MNRTGLLIALVIAAVVGVIFGLYPELDLRLVRPFYEIDRGGSTGCTGGANTGFQNPALQPAMAQ